MRARKDEQHAQYLTPSFALSGTIPSASPAYENMSAAELEAFLAEMEPDIRAADRDMTEIEMLEKKGVTGAGNLAGECASFSTLPQPDVVSNTPSVRGFAATPAGTRQSAGRRPGTGRVSRAANSKSHRTAYITRLYSPCLNGLTR
jgi:hypothetical protein